MNQAPAPEGLPPSLRFLKFLVILLAITLIVGVITVVAVIVTRMPSGEPAIPALPDAIALPQGVSPRAVTFGTGWTAIVTSDDRILIFATDGRLRQEIRLLPE